MEEFKLCSWAWIKKRHRKINSIARFLYAIVSLNDVTNNWFLISRARLRGRLLGGGIECVLSYTTTIVWSSKRKAISGDATCQSESANQSKSLIQSKSGMAIGNMHRTVASRASNHYPCPDQPPIDYPLYSSLFTSLGRVHSLGKAHGRIE